jgi:hypothetical protein
VEHAGAGLTADHIPFLRTEIVLHRYRYLICRRIEINK